MIEFKDNPVQNFSFRDMLFGDMPLSYWSAIDSEEEPWTSFKKVKKSLEKGEIIDVVDTLNKIIKMPNLESRQYLQAYHFLQEAQGINEGEKKLFGVIVEVGMDQGNDILAVYADHSSRYYNYSEKSIIWENADDSLNSKIDIILSESEKVLSKIGPWESERPAAPVAGMARINFLTSHGLHFGEATQADLFGDALAGKLMYAMLGMMQKLIDKTNSVPPENN